MPRYVVLEFEDDDQANTFVDDWQDQMDLIEKLDVEGLPRFLTPGQENDVPVNIVAMTIKPTQFCACKKIHGSAKGKKWGLWICKNCGKPSRRWGKSYKQVIGSAKNLLDEDGPDPQRITMEELRTMKSGGTIRHNDPPGP